MIKLIASDIDGTLLQNHSREISPRLRTLLQTLVDNGIYFVAASGRQYGALYKLLSPISDKFFYAAENGCVCAHNDTIIKQHSLPQKEAYEIIDDILEFPDCYAMVSCIDSVYIDEKNKLMSHIVQDEIQYRTTIVDNLKTDIPGTILKVASFAEDGPERMYSHFKSRYNDYITVSTAGLYWLDFGSLDANKGVGLQAILDYLGIDAKDCIAFGDQFNDLEMLQLAGTSYIVSSHAPGLEKYADHVIDSVDDVLEQIIKEYGF